MALKGILPSRLGFGAAPLGNMFRAIPEAEALATVEAAWNDGIRYFDNAPFYGAGLAEIRMGEALKAKPRDEYAISTKVGRIVLDEIEQAPRDNGKKGDVFANGRPNKVINDYSEGVGIWSQSSHLGSSRSRGETEAGFDCTTHGSSHLHGCASRPAAKSRASAIKAWKAAEELRRLE